VTVITLQLIIITVGKGSKFGRNFVSDRFSITFLLKLTLSHYVRFEDDIIDDVV
jgi:hypothetical protein